MSYEDMSDFEVNKAVARHLPFDWYWSDSTVYLDIDHTEVFDPCNNPSDAWPIIVENGICINAMAGGDFTLWYSNDKHYTNVDNAVYSENPLRAAMICFLKMKDAER